MKKKVLFSLCLLAGAGIQAQVGVNNTDPKASLHITPQKTDGTTAEGIIAPNLTRAQLIGKDVRYTAAQKGAIVYVTTLDGTISAKTTKITTIGYYYFDGALWQPFSQAETVVPTEPWRVQGGAAQAISNTENIYQAGKVAIGVAQTGAAKSETLYVDGDTHLQGTTKVGTTAAPANAAISGTSTLTGKVGIGRAPATSHILAIEGNTYSKGNITNEGDLTVTAGGLTVSSTGTFTLAGNGVGAGKYLASDAAGKGTWTTLPTTATTEPWRVQGGTTLATSNTENIYQAGTVSIGGTAAVPAGYKLLVSGSSQVNGSLKVQETGIFGTSKKYTTTNYTLHVFGEGNLGGLWVDKFANLKSNVHIGESLTAADNALTVSSGTTVLKGATTIGTAAAPATLNVTGTTTSKATNMGGLLKYKPTAAAVTVGQYMKASAVDGSVEWATLPTTATTEPWRVQGSTVEATTNTQSIYQMGRVNIGESTDQTTHQLQVTGATLLKGTTTVGTTTAPASFVVTGTTHTKAANVLGVLKYKPSTTTAVAVGQYMRASAVDGSVEWGALPTTATTEPWRVQGGTTLATSNTEHIYQAGRVAIGVAQTTPGLTQALYVNGATLLKGSTTVGTTAAPSNLTITGTSALVGNTQVGTAAAPTNLTVTGTSALVKATTVGTTAANANLVVNGNAGIGAAPLHKLHVAGNEYVSGRAKVGGAADPATLFASAQLELADTDKGFLPNRVALTNSTLKAPVPYAVDGMMVYNTATVAAQDISPGFYYWKANRWNRLVDVIPNKSISLLNLQAARTSASVNGGGGTAGGTHLAFTNKVGIGDYIEIPEDGSYAFSFRLYGIMSGTASSTTIVYYLNLMRGTTILDVAEMDIPFVKNPAIGQVLTYSVTLGADLVAGDKVYFRLGHLSATPYPWALAAHSSNSNAARTSMVWWKL